MREAQRDRPRPSLIAHALELTLQIGNAGERFSARKGRRKAPVITSPAAVTLQDPIDWPPLVTHCSSSS
jgi:hypothetical protein